MPVTRKRPAEPEKSHETKFVVGMYCGAAYHDWAFAGVDGCEVVRLYDVESDMCRLAKLFLIVVVAAGTSCGSLTFVQKTWGNLLQTWKPRLRTQTRRGYM